MTKAPAGLGAGGRQLWRSIADEYELDAVQQVQLLEACRAKDRLDKLDSLLRGDVTSWARLTHRLQTEDYELKIDAALTQANTTANLMKQLLAALRLPDPKTGKRPQYRGARGAQAPSVPGGKGRGTVTALDKFREASGG
ncbi:hypothetical protein [Micromonospora carbonacea]|uniref:Terminase n=1 Tax=Micromonospora carbonacea TaxID=47853 RepID=A0A1C5A2N2_9ACTN|nr:hypothetical protein [Micromonospora carbonacea]SCF39351.1 hypothetical protein GA0070563_11110 [Micromonospora carbonacea]